MDECPNFWTVFADAIRMSAQKRKALAYFPWWLLLCCVVPVAAVWLLNGSLRSQITEASAVTVMSAIAVVAGFFGSVSVAVMGQTQRMVSEYPFSSYLKDEKLFDLFLFWPQFTLLIQIFLILFSTASAIFIRLADFEYLNKFIIAFDMGLLIYVCTKTWGLIDLVRNLTWHYEHYNRLFRENSTN